MRLLCLLLVAAASAQDAATPGGNFADMRGKGGGASKGRGANYLFAARGGGRGSKGRGASLGGVPSPAGRGPSSASPGSKGRGSGGVSPGPKGRGSGSMSPYSQNQISGGAMAKNSVGAAKTTRVPPLSTSPSKLSVAVCATGKSGTMLSAPVVRGLYSNVFDKLKPSTRKISLFVALTFEPESKKASTRAAVQKKYSRGDFLADVEFVKHQEEKPTCAVETKPAKVGPRSVMQPHRQVVSKAESTRILTMWKAVRQVYRAVEKSEIKNEFKFDWIIRMRTDLVWMSPMRTSHFIDKAPLVPWGDIWVDPLQSCMNDHVFACPRGQCRSYFHVLELWESPHCTGPSQGEDSASPLPAGNDGPPTSPYTLPSPPVGFGPMWLVTRRYGATTCSNPDSVSCCGRIKRTSWNYALARGNATHGTVQLDRYAPH